MTEVFFNSSGSRIEGIYHNSGANSPVVLILHPHPQHGGTMHNKVIYYMCKVFAANHFNVLRINFRGVGRSTGQFNKGVGELNDAAVAMDWLQNQNTNSVFYWVAGFSFGAWIAMQLLMRRPEISNFVAVAPPVGLYDFSFLSPCPTKGLIIQGDNDQVVKEAAVSQLITNINKQTVNVEYKKIPGADHFFNQQTADLITTIDEYIKQYIIIQNSQNLNVKTDKKRRRLRVS